MIEQKEIKDMVSNSYGNGLVNELVNSYHYLALSSTEPQKDGTGVTEPSGNGYARVQLGSSYFPNASNCSVSNNNEIHFNEATAAWDGSYQYACIYTSKTGGTLQAWGKLQNAITVAANTVPLIRVGQFTISIKDSE